MPDIVLAKKGINHWIQYIKQRIKKNKNFLGFVSGPTGSGKSYSSVSIGEQVDPTFNEERIVFSGVELMKLINSDKLKKGSCVVMEEMGVEASNRNWQSSTNKMLNYLMQTFRHRCFVLIMNSPYMDFVDAGMRKLFHAEMMTQGIDYNTKECKLKPQLIQYNARLKKFYYKRLKVMTKDGIVPVNSWAVPKPSEELLKVYEAKKRKFTDELNKKIWEELTEQAGESKKELTQVQEEIINSLREGLLVDDIAKKRNVRTDVIYEHMNRIKKKGYKIRPIRVQNRVIKYEIPEN